MKEDWKYSKLGDICDLYQPKTISGDMLVEDGEYLVYGANGIIGRYDKYNHEESEVLLTCRGATCGSINISEPYSWINGNAMVVHPSNEKELRKDFIRYYLASVDWSKVITGAAQPQITRQSLSPLQVACPPLSEQENIVAELDCLSGVIEKQKQQLKELDNLAQAIFYDMFGDPITNEKGWAVKRLGELVKVRGGYAFKSNLFTDEGVPVLRIGNINTGRLRTTQLVFYKEDNTLSKYVVYPDDLVISLTGTAGKDDYGNVCILDNTYPKYYLNQRNAKIEVSSHIQTTYLQYFLKDRGVKCTLTGINRGVRQGNISNKDIEDLVIPIVPLSLQQEFASKIEDIERQKELIKQSISETETLFNCRMDYYFN